MKSLSQFLKESIDDYKGSMLQSIVADFEEDSKAASKDFYDVGMKLRDFCSDNSEAASGNNPVYKIFLKNSRNSVVEAREILNLIELYASVCSYVGDQLKKGLVDDINDILDITNFSDPKVFDLIRKQNVLNKILNATAMGLSLDAKQVFQDSMKNNKEFKMVEKIVADGWNDLSKFIFGKPWDMIM